ncbi:MAG: M15 family metallopeptidase [Hyphomicrobiaceae bacterium]|nr:M15 family metallopeptidase [Hyphomicrobiaceae bacterium]
MPLATAAAGAETAAGTQVADAPHPRCGPPALRRGWTDCARRGDSETKSQRHRFFPHAPSALCRPPADRQHRRWCRAPALSAIVAIVLLAGAPPVIADASATAVKGVDAAPLTETVASPDTSNAAGPARDGVGGRDGAARERDAPSPAALRALVAGYPDHLQDIDGDTLVWRDGSRTRLDDGTGRKTYEAWLARPDIADTLSPPYRPGPINTPPVQGDDPGRARNTAFFDRVYGDCSKGGVAAHLVDVVWLPGKYGRKIKATRINGVADRLSRISRELDALPMRFDRYLFPPAGTYVCRAIAGTDRRSAHGYGIAIDIATADSDYWRWSSPAPGKNGNAIAPAWRNRIPHEIVAIFEKHGFIWGGKWHHFDTMHFEYRPELLPPTAPR